MPDVPDPSEARSPRRRSGPALVTPWEGRPTRADWVIIAGIVGSAVYGLALIPVIPALLGSHPLLLEVISGSALAEVTVGALSRVGDVPIVVAVAAGVPASMMFDWAFWWAGRRWGDRALTMLLGQHGRRSPQAAAKRAARLERVAHRFGPAGVVLAYYLPLPSPLVYAAAGLSGMRLWVFLLLDAVGTTLWVGLLVGLGYAIGQRAIDVVDRFNHYALWVTIGLVVLLVAVQVLRAVRDERRARGAGNGAGNDQR